MQSTMYTQKGRGAQINPPSPFEKLSRGAQVTDPGAATQFIPVRSKRLINEVDSPDIPHNWSVNPYQGCEHGCVYCYARNTHPYWGYSAGMDFERKVMVKLDAPRVLEETFQKPSWKASPIMLSGNTDCYQPAEKHYRLTRQILEVCLKYRHPVSIVTKNALILRDLDLLRELAEYQLVHVAFSITSLQAGLQQILEPRTSTPEKKLLAIRTLSDAGVPVMVLAAPIIPAINQQEILPIARAVAEAGALSFQHMVVRLNGALPELFVDWLDRYFPDRKEKVLNGIKSLHGGSLQNSRFGHRMKGAGNLAVILAKQAEVARRKYHLNQPMPALNTSLHAFHKTAQMDLFAQAC
ncbi:MAG: PA0069 family radical SAM protein [Lewinellaceae bacterium]|nr:PA0069 family radical SAM protein [Lewinellaceae bacterium]HRW75128.1 PA0069 family radical SAM protein [Saprospiraceae bacterium]